MTEAHQEDAQKRSVLLLLGTWAMIGAVSLIILAMALAVVWLLFAPNPSAQAQEAAEIIEEDISAALSDAQAMRIDNSADDESVLTVETAEGTCKAFRVLNDGRYQAFESEGRIPPGYMDFEPVNYTQAHIAENTYPAFDYHFSPEELRHGAHVNLVIGATSTLDSRALDISGGYRADLDTESESFCWVSEDAENAENTESDENAQ